VPGLAWRVAAECAADLTTRTGKLTQLHHCAVLIADGQDYSGPLYEPAKAKAEQLAKELA
jgi:hypothetical protein